MLPAPTVLRVCAGCLLVAISFSVSGQNEYLHLRYSGAEGSEYHALETIQKLTYTPAELVVHFTDGAVMEVSLDNLRYFNYEAPTAVDEHTADGALISMTAYPNPGNGIVRIRCDVPMATNVRLVVYDASGREAEQLEEQFRPEGTFEIAWDTRRHKPGMYFCQMLAGDQIITERIIVTP